MRMFLIVLTVVPALMVLATSMPAFGSDKYKRSKPKSTDSSDTSSGATPTNSPSPGQGQSGDKKVDLSDLENRYWTAKDTEFNVVQNRLYTKAKRWALTPAMGIVLSDQYNSAYNFGLSVNYYFSERSGVELVGWGTAAAPSETVNYFSNRFGVQPDYNVPTGYIGANYNWIPIYAKLSLLEKKILYFDMSVNPGLGVTLMRSNVFSTTTTNPTATSQTAPTLAIDVAQQVFIDEHWALRLDLRNHMYNEQVYNASTGNALRQKFTYYGTVMFGVTYFH